MTYTMITRTKWRIRHGNLSCCWSRWSWMSTRAHEYIGLSPKTTRGSVPFEGNHYMHMYGGDACMHACLNTQHWCGACVKNRTLAPHTERDRFMMCRCTSHFDSMGGIHAYTCMCVCAQTVSCMSSQSKNNNPLLSQINLSCCQAKRSDGPSRPTDGKHRYRW